MKKNFLIPSKRQGLAAEKNTEIELLRFLFAVGIMASHYQQTYQYRAFTQGGFGVEYFLLLSGLLMARSAEKFNGDRSMLGSATWKFIKKKIIVFYPYYVMVMLLQFFFLRVLIEHWSFSEAVKQGLAGMHQLYFAEVTGAYVDSGLVISGRWFLSAMVWSMVILYPILLRWNDYSKKVLFPLIGAFGLGYLQMNYKQIMQTYSWGGICGLGLIRGLSEISLGVVCYEIAKSLKLISPRLTKLGKASLILSKTGCFLIVFLYVASIITLSPLTVLLITGIGLVLVFGGGGLSGLPPVMGRLFGYLGKLSLPLYMVHVPVKTVLVAWLGEEATRPYVVPIMAGCILLAALMLHIMPIINTAIQKCGVLFIKDKE